MITMQQPIRWGIIGCGAVTEVKSGPAYQQTAGFELAAVMRRNGELAQDYAKRHHVALYFDDADELINHPDIDAVYVATPPDSHRFYGLKVAKAGKPCCIEKPLAPSFNDGMAIVQTFADADLPLFVAYYRRSLPRFNRVKSLLESGVIGDLRHVSWYLTKAPNDKDLSGEYNWRTDSQVAAAGYFDDLASHGLDLMAFLFGRFQSVHGICANQQGLYTAFDAVTACWQHQSGVTGSGHWHFGCQGRADDVVVYGSGGQLAFSMFDDKPIVVNNAEGETVYRVENPAHIQQFHVENMADALFNGQPHPSTGSSALHTCWVMEQILSTS